MAENTGAVEMFGDRNDSRFVRSPEPEQGQSDPGTVPRWQVGAVCD